MKSSQILNELDFAKVKGLLPVIVQEYESNKVLTLAYTNKEALLKTLETGYAHYYRRSLKKVLKKGVTSGNIQKIVRIKMDCDKDALLYQVYQKGKACHLEEESCFMSKIIETENFELLRKTSQK